LKIAIVTLGIYPIHTGGVELHSWKLLAMLLAKGDKVICITKKRTGDEFHETTSEYPVVSLGSGSAIVGPFEFLVSASLRLLRMRRQIEVVHVQYATYFLIPAYFFGLLTGRPFIASCRGSDLIYWSRHWFWKRAQRFLLENAAYVSAVSSQMASILVDQYHLSPKKVVIIPNAVDEEEINRIPKDSPERSKLKRVIFLGNLRAVKDPLAAIEAFRLLNRSMKDTELLVVGDGPLKKQAMEYVRTTGISDSVVFKGMVSHSEALKLLNSSDALVISSLSEGNPNVVIEAMALGIPVVGTSVGGLRDLVIQGETGMLVEPQSPKRLADALYTILNDSELAHSITVSAKRKVAKYTWATLTSAYESLYARAIAGNA
jgi:glycosyltransferase involved in cell wall biosynthesis